MFKKDISDFHAVLFKLSDDEKPIHLLIKEHSSNTYEEDKPLGRTLFVLNVPPWLDDDDLKHAFSEAGDVCSLKLQRGVPHNDTSENTIQSFNGYKSGFIVFDTRESLLKANSLTQLGPCRSHPKKKHGLRKYALIYNNSMIDPSILYQEATETIKKYDAEQEEKKNAENNQIDDDGWTVVSKKGRNPGLALKESVETKLTEKNRQKMKKKMLPNFYSFQIRESKKKHLALLRDQHEEAKKKITEMKKKRTFKPY